MSTYYPPYRSSSNNIKVELDLGNYATKTDLKNITHVDVSSFASKTNLAALKTEVDKIDVDKLKTTPIDLAKLSNVVKNDVVKKTYYNAKVTSIEGQIAEITKNTIDNLADITKLKAVDTNSLEDEMIIPPQLFEIPKKILFLQVPFCEANEKRSKNFLNKFYNFTNEKFKLIIRWKTRNLKSLFPLKDKDLHPACKIYKGICSCESTYVGETKRNVEVRYSEHNHPSGKSEPSKHLYQNINHVFTWSVICSAPKIDRTRKNLEAFYIALMRPNLNEQCDSNVLTLFRNGIT